MNDQVRSQLTEIIHRQGEAILADPYRLEALLKDLCGEHKREINSLIDALRERVPPDLRAIPTGTPPALLLAGLTQRLLANRPLTEEMARWAVESWAVALGLLTQEQLPPAPAPTPQPNQPRVLPPPVRAPVPLPRLPFEPRTVVIPEGEFWMGSTDEQILQALQAGLPKWVGAQEQPWHRVGLGEYALGKYPVTCFEYQVFVRDTGQPSPPGWQKSEYPPGKGDHPVVRVGWDEAAAYCTWLSRKTGRDYRLPSEAEWEKAARGSDGRIYPWGDADPDRARCNIENWFNGTTPVGQFSPDGDSPFGCADMVGNVHEWTRSLYRAYPYDPRDGREDLGIRAARALRSAAFSYNRRYARCAFRSTFNPNDWLGNVGFRVVCGL